MNWERKKVRVPCLSERAWSVLYAASDDWENIETISNIIRRLIELSAKTPEYLPERKAWPNGPVRQEILKILRSLHARGLVRAAREIGQVLQPVMRLDDLERDPESYWFLANEDLRALLLELSFQRRGGVPLDELKAMCGEEVEVLMD